MQGGDQVVSRAFGNRKPHVTSGFHSAHLVLAFFYIPLGLVIHVKTGKSHDDSDGLDGVNGLGKPEDGDADNGDAFDEGSDGISDGRSGGEDYEGDDVLSEMHGAVEEKIVYDGM